MLKLFAMRNVGNIVKRAHIILLANGNKLSNKEVAEQVGMNKCDVTRWTSAGLNVSTIR